MNIGICDDDQDVLIKTGDYISRLSTSLNKEMILSSFSSPKELIKTHAQNCNLFSLLFLDIEMGSINGLDVAHILRKNYDYKGELVFLTSHPDFMAHSFDVAAAHYLIKPVSYETFAEKTSPIIKRLSDKSDVAVFKTVDFETIFIPYEKIVSFHPSKDIQRKDILEVVTTTGSSHIRASMASLNERLSSRGFFLIHRSSIVNLSHVRKIVNSDAVMSDGRTLKIGRVNGKALKEVLIHHMDR